jgi:hypothetical protein
MDESRGESRGDLRGSAVGVRVRLGIRKWCDAVVAGEVGVTTLSGLSSVDASARLSVPALCFGGDEGGSTVRDGGNAGREVSGGKSMDRAGEDDRLL